MPVSPRRRGSPFCWRSRDTAAAGLALRGLFAEETSAELAIFRTAAEMRRLYGPAAVTNSVISKADGISDVLEVALLLKEVGLLRPGEACST